MHKPKVTIFLYSNSKKLLGGVRNLLIFLGFHPTPVLEYKNNVGTAYRIAIYRINDIRKFYRLIGFRVDYKQYRLEKAFKIFS